MLSKLLQYLIALYANNCSQNAVSKVLNVAENTNFRGYFFIIQNTGLLILKSLKVGGHSNKKK